jgi:hypothetical protein
VGVSNDDHVIAEQARAIVRPLIEAFATLPLDAKPALSFQAGPAADQVGTGDLEAAGSS